MRRECCVEMDKKEVVLVGNVEFRRSRILMIVIDSNLLTFV